MPLFGQVAVLAAEICRDSKCEPREAWNRAAKKLLSKPSRQEKNCPRATFLVLCQEGLIDGIPTGDYVAAEENRDHALAAVSYLARDASLSTKPLALWKLVIGNATTGHDSQMHVLMALWNRGLIRPSSKATH